MGLICGKTILFTYTSYVSFIDHLCRAWFLDGKHHLIGTDLKLTISGSPETLLDRSYNVYITVTHHHHPLLSL